MNFGQTESRALPELPQAAMKKNWSTDSRKNGHPHGLQKSIKNQLAIGELELNKMAHCRCTRHTDYDSNDKT